MSNEAKYLRVEMPDGTLWDVPVDVIARNRAAHYACEFEGDIERSLAEDTLPCFEESPFEIQDWAANNMNWSDVAAVARRVALLVKPVDYEEGWVNGRKTIVTKPVAAAKGWVL
jgi:hypothetical protein